MASTVSASNSLQTDPPNGSSGNVQSPVGSPPLILAFLAIGIFSAAMIAVFGWRRVQFGRDPGLWGYTDPIGSPGRRATRSPDPAGSAGSKFGDKPILWEVCIDRNKKVEGAGYGLWGGTMPLAVLPAPHGDPSSRILSLKCDPSPSPLPLNGLITSPEPPSIFLSPQTADSQRRQRLNEIGPMTIFHRHPPTNMMPNAQNDVVDQGHSDEKDKEERKDAQIVMIIEMPSPTKPRYRHAQSSGHYRRSSHYSSLSNSETLVDNTGGMREDLLGMYRDSGQFQYCVGVHTCPWPLSSTFQNSSGAEQHHSEFG